MIMMMMMNVVVGKNFIYLFQKKQQQ